MNLQSAQEKLGRKLTNVSEVAEGVLRGMRCNNGRDVAAYVFDLNNRLPDTVGNLSSYLDEVMGPSYFDEDASPDLRWNNYLYFVVDKATACNEAFQVTKRNVETDRSYARKFVVTEEDLDRVLDELDSVAIVDKSTAATDVVQAWSEMLSAAELDDVLDGERPIADVIRSISSGAARKSVRTKKITGVESSQQLVGSHIASINLSGFRPYPKRNSFEKLGKANLLFGSNGVGKTSLLEGLELLFCGANRRSNCSETAVVEALLASGQKVETSARQPLSDFKTRQRLWYGGDDNSRLNRLPNQFARFNFLNTDAAAELSLLKESPREGNADSLAALLSGHEATLMWRRIQDVRKAVEDETRSKQSELNHAELDQLGKKKEQLVLEEAPSQVDAAFSVFIKSLESLGWRDVPERKELVTEQFVGILSSLTSQLSAIQPLDWILGPITESTITQQLLVLNIACDEVKNEIPAARQDAQIRSVLAQRHGLANSKLIALEAIPPSALAELKAFSTAFKQSNDELAMSARLFAAIPSSVPPEGWLLSLGSKSLLAAYEEANSELRIVDDQLDSCQKRFAASTQTQSELQHAMTEVQSWAKKVIGHRHSDSNCPVCGTEFDPGELIQHMQALTLSPLDAEIIELRLLIEHITAERRRIAKEVSWLDKLVKFTNSLPDVDTSLTVRDAQQKVLNTIERQQFLLEAKQAAQQGIDVYERSGLSLAAIEKLYQPVDESASFDLTEALDGARQHLQELTDAIAEVDERVFRRNEILQRRINEAGVLSSDSLDTDIEQVMARQRITQRASDACAAVREYLNVAPETDMRSLQALLEDSVLDAKKVQASLTADSNSATRLTTVRKQLEELTSRISYIKEARERLTSSQQVLDDIIENQSLDAASASIISATHNVADSIFARIHAPAEYLITSDTEQPLKGRNNNLPIQLNQVSTGQRSAYALSMFLAMNAQVKAGPKVILLDDPISHIDDLNALSFLDYLRNLVIESDRQIFFATADEKIAGLFTHKFGFLGEDFQTIELAR